MKKNHVLSLLLTMLLCGSATAQIENEIKNYVDSTGIMMNNGRKLLVASVKDGNRQKSQEVFQYLSMMGDARNCAAFSFNEQLVLNVFFENWEQVLDLMRNYKNGSDELCYRFAESVQETILSELRKNNPGTEVVQQSIRLNKEEQELLDLYFYFLQNGSQDNKYASLKTRFLIKFPFSKYQNFVNNALPAAEINIDVSGTMGPKFSYPVGTLYNYFFNPVGLSLSTDFGFSRYYVSAYLDFSLAMLKKPLTLTGISGNSHQFMAGDVFKKYDMGLKTGYFIVRNNRLFIAPYASILTGGYMESRLYATQAETSTEFNIYNSLTPGLGACAEYKLFNYSMKNIPFYSAFLNFLPSGYVGIKLDAGFNAVFKSAANPAGGVFSYTTVSFVIGYGKP